MGYEDGGWYYCSKFKLLYLVVVVVVNVVNVVVRGCSINISVNNLFFYVD